MQAKENVKVFLFLKEQHNMRLFISLVAFVLSMVFTESLETTH